MISSITTVVSLKGGGVEVGNGVEVGGVETDTVTVAVSVGELVGVGEGPTVAAGSAGI